MTRLKCICSSCSRNCGGLVKSELALRRKLTFVYLNSGEKVTYNCSLYTLAKVEDETGNLLISGLQPVHAQLRFV